MQGWYMAALRIRPGGERVRTWSRPVVLSGRGQRADRKRERMGFRKVRRRRIVPMYFHLATRNHGQAEAAGRLVAGVDVFWQRPMREQLQIAQMISDDQKIVPVVPGNFTGAQNRCPAVREPCVKVDEAAAD